MVGFLVSICGTLSIPQPLAWAEEKLFFAHDLWVTELNSTSLVCYLATRMLNTVAGGRPVTCIQDLHVCRQLDSTATAVLYTSKAARVAWIAYHSALLGEYKSVCLRSINIVRQMVLVPHRNWRFKFTAHGIVCTSSYNKILYRFVFPEYGSLIGHFDQCTVWYQICFFTICQ